MINKGLVGQVQDTSDQFTTDKIVIKVGIHIGGELYTLAKWFGSVRIY